MILAKARLIGSLNGRVRVGLSFPSGFNPEDVVPESVKGNGVAAAEGFHVPPRHGSVVDLFRELEVSFASDAMAVDGAEGGTLQITGRLRRGMKFTASVRKPKPPSDPNTDD